MKPDYRGVSGDLTVDEVFRLMIEDTVPVHLSNAEEAAEFLELCQQRGIKWRSGTPATQFNPCGVVGMAVIYRPRGNGTGIGYSKRTTMPGDILWGDVKRNASVDPVDTNALLSLLQGF